MLDLPFITEVRSAGKGNPTLEHLAIMFEKIQEAINQTAQAAGVDSTQHLPVPDPPQAINVAAGSDHVHITIADTSKRSRALNYFIDHSTDPSFHSFLVEHLGVSRQRILALPAKDGLGATQNYYFRAYSAYPGSQTSSAKLTHGGSATPTAVTLSGSSQLTLLPSTGSGTNSSTGMEQPGGFGKAQFTR